MVASEAVNQLREDKLGSVIYKRNLKSYRINWNNRFGLSLETHDQYIREFVGDFYKAVIRLADRGAKKFDCSELGLLKLELQGRRRCNNLPLITKLVRLSKVSRLLQTKKFGTILAKVG